MLELTAATFLLLASSVTSARAAPTSTEVTFKGAGDFELRGTLMLPEAPNGEPGGGASGRVAAVLLLPGSGPTDRDGNQPPLLTTDLLRQIADRLTAEGVATLRFDKRAAHVHAGAWPKDPAAIDAFFSYENFVADATAAYRFLRSQERVDASRVAVLGHSEGGLFALQIGRDLGASEDRPAGLVLVSTAGRMLDEVLREQIKAALWKQTPDQSVRDNYLGHLERGIAAARNEEPFPADIPPGLVAIFNPSVRKLLHSYFTVDPAVLAAEVRGPVLVIQGGRDAQVSADRDARRLEEALRKRSAAPGAKAALVEMVIVADASHNLKKVEGDKDPGGMAGFVGPVVPEALDRIADWCRKHLSQESR